MSFKKKIFVISLVGFLIFCLGISLSWAQTKWDMPMAYPVTNFHSVNGQKFA